MSTEENFASYFDSLVRLRQEQVVASMRRVPSLKDSKERQEQIESWQRIDLEKCAEALTRRAKDAETQAELIRTHYSAPIYNTDLWRQISWLDRLVEPKPTSEDPALHLSYRGHGRIDVTPDEVAYTPRAAMSLEAIEYGVRHAKTAWQGHAIELDGAEPFKAASWAFAQLHGVKVKDYQPEGEALKYAQRIIAHHTKLLEPDPTKRGDVKDLLANNIS